ncbi:MAG: DUF4007 family protein [Leptotrichiaceae bacterium]|nr:DUF4007 family protein [Leptotrichiaceae bacterium]
MNSKQGFRFEVPYSIKILKEISKGNNTKEKLKEVTGAGENRIIVFLEWLKYINSIKIEKSEVKLTELGKTYLKIHQADDFLEPLMLYHLLRNPDLEENDGQFYFSEMINGILNQVISDYSNTITVKQLLKEMYGLGAEEKYPQFITAAINALQDSDSGFGKMGILEELPNQKETFEVHSYWVEPLVAAYIIYDMWQDGQTAMSIDKITNDKYNLGRMFLMDKDAIMETLEEIQYKNLITIESGAGLNQIRIKPGINKSQILDMIIDEA